MENSLQLCKLSERQKSQHLCSSLLGHGYYKSQLLAAVLPLSTWSFFLHITSDSCFMQCDRWLSSFQVSVFKNDVGNNENNFYHLHMSHISISYTCCCLCVVFFLELTMLRFNGWQKHYMCSIQIWWSIEGAFHRKAMVSVKYSSLMLVKSHNEEHYKDKVV